MASIARCVLRSGLLTGNNFMKRNVAHNSNDTGSNNTHFGFETVTEDEKEHRGKKLCICIPNCK